METDRIIDVNRIVRENTEKWINFDLTRVNDCVVRLGIFEGEFHWHHHEKEDEMFFVLAGNLLLDIEGRTIELGPNQGYTVKKGTEHRTRSKVCTVCLMMEGDTVDPRGDGR